MGMTRVVTEDGKNMLFGSYCDEMMSEEMKIFDSAKTNRGIDCEDKTAISRFHRLYLL